MTAPLPDIPVHLHVIDAHTCVADMRLQEGSTERTIKAVRRAANQHFWGRPNLPGKMTHVFQVPTVAERLFVCSNRALSYEQARVRGASYLEKAAPLPRAKE